MNSLLTVIVPIYNSEMYLDDCVSSILNQTYKNIELILVDDGSSDDSLSLCHRWQELDVRVKVIHQENAGPGAARNTGIEAARGDYIAFVDSDDTVADTMYQRMLELAEDNSADMVCSNLYDSVNEEKEVLVFNRDEALGHRLRAQIISDSTVDKLYNRGLFNELRYPTDRNISEDSALVYRLIASSERIVCTDERFYYIRATENSLSRSKYEGRYTGIIDTYEEMVCFFQSTKEPEFEKIATQKAVNAVLLNVGEYYCSKCRDKRAKKIIIDHARWQLRKYELSARNKLLLMMAANCFSLLGIIYYHKNKRKKK